MPLDGYLQPGDAHCDATSRSHLRWLLLAGTGCLAAVICWASLFRTGSDQLLAQAKVAFELGDVRVAMRKAERVLESRPDDAAAMVLLGRCQEASGDMNAATRTFERVPAGQRPHSVEAAWRCGHLYLLHLRRPHEAQRCYLRALDDDPHALMANEGLTILWGFSGQWWRQIRPRLAMFRAGKIDRVQLLSLALAEKSLDVSIDVVEMQSGSPNDPLVLLAMARLAVEENDYSSAVRMLKSVLEASPRLVNAQVRLGEIYLELGDEAKFARWSRQVPVEAELHPSLWVLRGKWAHARRMPDVALRCFCEAVRRDANQVDALYQAGQILIAMQRPADAAPFLKRASDLQQFLNAVKAVEHDGDVAAIRRASELAESLGNTWEAFGWATLAAVHPSKPAWAQRIRQRLLPRVKRLPLRRTEQQFNPAASFDYESFPEFSSSEREGDASSGRSHGGKSEGIAFQDMAQSAGVDFQYFNGARHVEQGTRFMYEVMGGGVAVLDLNNDLRPDLYFAQGCEWPVNESEFRHLDRLFVNRGDGRFTDVTALTGIRENGFSQGVAAGDFDSDGFSDLLVANIGANRLYRNNGDGTFSDVSLDVGLVRSDWSTSCAIADVTGDGQPELYFVNYLTGDDVFTRACGPLGNSACLPQHFPAADDRLYWNRGDGTCEDVTGSSGIAGAQGKGLGLVIARFNETRPSDIFVANDTVGNSYFVNDTVSSHERPQMSNKALVSGLAMSAEGRTQACMGVAAGDADGDGRLELFVTNFHGESNALYRGDGVTFQDVASGSGLRQASLSKLGFGTQFLDADLDGWSDLLVANGHIDNFSRDGRTDYQMQPQLFANAGHGEFVEGDPAGLGEYFERKVLGRALARLDWNLDGLEDAVVTHLDAPVALLTNTTRQPGGFVSVRLRGTESSRDAIGAVVEVTLSHRTVTQQLTAGDGFQACNERTLVLGLGNENTARQVTVRWPSGLRSEFGPVKANSRWIAVEGAERLYSAATNQ